MIPERKRHPEARKVDLDELEQMCWDNRESGEKIEASCNIATLRTPDGVFWAHLSRPVSAR